MSPENLWQLLFLPGIPLGVTLLWPFIWAKKRDKRSRRPFTDMPRPAGWSLQERTQDLLLSAVMELVILITLGLSLCLSGNLKSPSILVIAFATAGSLFFAARFRKKLIAFANHSLGLQGEQLVGSVLDRLSSDSIHVFHDIEIKLPGKRTWNIDHVALTPAGLFVFETKARRKPRLLNPSSWGRVDYKVVFNGDELVFPNATKDRQSTRQARRNADWLATKLAQNNATDIPVSSAIVIPGWWIDRIGRGPVCALNEKQIKSYINVSPVTLPKQLFNAISNQLNELSKVSFA